MPINDSTRRILMVRLHVIDPKSAEEQKEDRYYNYVLGFPFGTDLGTESVTQFDTKLKTLMKSIERRLARDITKVMGWEKEGDDG